MTTLPGYRLCRRCQYIQTTDEERTCSACRTEEPRSPAWWELVRRWEGRRPSNDPG